MPRDFLHNHPQFADLIRIVADAEAIRAAIVDRNAAPPAAGSNAL